MRVLLQSFLSQLLKPNLAKEEHLPLILLPRFSRPSIHGCLGLLSCVIVPAYNKQVPGFRCFPMPPSTEHGKYVSKLVPSSLDLHACGASSELSYFLRMGSLSASSKRPETLKGCLVVGSWEESWFGSPLIYKPAILQMNNSWFRWSSGGSRLSQEENVDFSYFNTSDELQWASALGSINEASEYVRVLSLWPSHGVRQLPYESPAVSPRCKALQWIL